MQLTTWEKMKLFQLAVHIIAAVGLVILWNPYWLVVSFVCWFFIYLYGGAIGYHRLWSHKAFEANNFVKYSSMFVGMLMGQGALFSWVGQHRLHHKYSDVPDKDPYYAHTDSALETLKIWFLSPHPINYEINMVKDLVKDKWVRFTHNHYYKIIFSWVILLAVINPMLALYGWFIPSVLCYISAQVTGIFGHKIGNTIYDINDKSKNSTWLNIFTLGESYQNTHHKYPRKLIMGEYDITGILVNRFITKK